MSGDTAQQTSSQRTLSQLTLVRIGRPMDRSGFATFADRLRGALGALIEELDLDVFEPPPIDRIEASLLTGALHESFGERQVLGVTDVDLVDSQGEDFFPFMFGGKDHRSHVAVVSTARLSSPDPDRAVDRALKVGLHEIGHNFGLEHHYAFVRAGDGAYCPMSKGDYNRYGERGYVRAVIDARGCRFCADCHTSMARYARAHSA